MSMEIIEPNRRRLNISLKPAQVETLYRYVLRAQQNKIAISGFQRGDVPISYLDNAFKNNIFEHLKKLFFIHGTVNYLYNRIIEQKIPLIGEPLLKSTVLDTNAGALYTFECVYCDVPITNDWKRLPFKIPTRKNYRDIDRQVDLFFNQENKTPETPGSDAVTHGDWVLFKLVLIDHDRNPLTYYTDLFWIHLGDEFIDRDVYELFFDKKTGDQFTTSNDLFQDHIANELDHRHVFLVTILERVAQSFFSTEQFRKHFKLKSTREIYAKLIEVFSYRNDISQRKEIINAAFKVLFKNYPFSPPEYLVARQQESILRDLQKNPDYTTYKNQPDFKLKVKKLAENQVKEQIIIGRIACDERIRVADEEVVCYLNLTKRPRTKEFIYFGLPQFKSRGHEMPIPHEFIRYYCLKEKTLNHIINNLTKR